MRPLDADPRARTLEAASWGLIAPATGAGSSQVVGRSAQALRGARRSLLCLSAAEGHSRSMVQLGYFAHVGPGGRGPVDRVLGSGYLLQTWAWTLGENIAFGVGAPSTPRAIMRAWMASTPHRANVLAPQFRQVGIGVGPGAPGRPSVTGSPSQDGWPRVVSSCGYRAGQAPTGRTTLPGPWICLVTRSKQHRGRRAGTRPRGWPTTPQLRGSGCVL